MRDDAKYSAGSPEAIRNRYSDLFRDLENFMMKYKATLDMEHEEQTVVCEPKQAETVKSRS